GAKAAAGNWFQPSFNDKRWLVGASPFNWDREMQTNVVDQSPPEDISPAGERLVNFRFEFELPAGVLKKESKFKFEVQALGGVQHLWLNGLELKLDDRVKRGRHEYSVPPLPEKPAAPAKPTASKGVPAVASAPVPLVPPSPPK